MKRFLKRAVEVVRRTGRSKRKMSPATIGVVFLIVTSVTGVLLFQKDRISTTLSSGETVPIHFAQDYKLTKYSSAVKVAGVKVGTVSDVERLRDGSALVDVKVTSGIRKSIGTMPSAAIRPTTLLGGSYYIDLVPGGTHSTRFSGTIPVQRTHVPVELDKVARVFQPDAVNGLRTATRQLDATLGNGGQSALDNLVHDAPGTLQPGSGVLDAARGTQPDTDLSGLVQGLNSTSKVLSRQHGQLESIVDNLNTTSAVLGRRSDDLAASVATLPQTVQTTDRGMKRLDTTLTKLRDTAGPARPAVQQLDQVITHATPVVTRARPVVHDLRGVLGNAQPLVEELSPTSQEATGVLNDVRGPVVDRLNGPIKNMVLSPYKGTGPYQGSGGDGKTFYQSLGYMVANIDRASKVTDGNGATIGFHPGIGAGTVAGLPINLEQLMRNLQTLPGTRTKDGGR